MFPLKRSSLFRLRKVYTRTSNGRNVLNKHSGGIVDLRFSHRWLWRVLASLCSPLKADWCFGGVLFLHFKSACQFFAWFSFRPWRWRRYIPSKRFLPDSIFPYPRAYDSSAGEKLDIAVTVYCCRHRIELFSNDWLECVRKSCCFYFSIQFKVKYRNVDDKFCVMNCMPCYCLSHVSNIQTH
jgi:hypothetical protein